MGLDYRLRGVGIQNNDAQKQTKDNLNYYSQNARFYMTTWLNQDVEAAFRLQAVNIWGLEGSGTPLTRYPKADGTPWVEEAYIHLPKFNWDRLDVIIGRQPIDIGDGTLVSSDQLGFNALRVRLDLPLKINLDIFAAKISESLSGQKDADLYGGIFGWDVRHNHWELAWIEEKNGGPGVYELATGTTTANKVNRRFYDIRLQGNLKDAFYKLEFAMAGGKTDFASGSNATIKGVGQKLEIGAQSDTVKYGRFGVRALYAMGTGDDSGTPGKDEAFRPTYARRWDGLQRTGYGSHFAATLSDAYDSAAPFSPAATGLPVGYSGIKTLGFGIFSTQKVFWTGALDYFIYEANKKPSGTKDLGSEIDVDVTYRYTGFVTLRLGGALFFPGEAYGSEASRVTRTTAEIHVHF